MDTLVPTSPCGALRRRRSRSCRDTRASRRLTSRTSPPSSIAPDKHVIGSRQNCGIVCDGVERQLKYGTEQIIHNSSRGGTASLRGYIYQFDRTMLEAMDRPDETIQVEQPLDMYGQGWCGEVKLRSSSYVPSAITDGVKALWKEHHVDPERELWLHCHFKDCAPGNTVTFSANEIQEHWGSHIDTTGSQSGGVMSQFASKLRVHFTPDLYSQFTQVISRIRSTFQKRSHEDAIQSGLHRRHIVSMLVMWSN